MNTTDLFDAVTAFVAAFADLNLADDLAARLTCAELNALVNLIDAAGDNATATAWLEAHSLGDEEGDEHWDTRRFVESGHGEFVAS